MAKRLLLCISHTNGISQLLEKHLIQLGFDVVLLCPHTEQEFIYSSFWQWAWVKIRKTVCREKATKRKLQSALFKQNLKKQLNGQKFDYALFFLCQNFSLDLLQFIQQQTQKGGMINYQWDGIGRYSHIQPCLAYFDHCFVFDPTDMARTEYPYQFATSFYFEEKEILPIENEFYFLGSDIADRRDEIIAFANFAEQNQWQIKFEIVADKDAELIKTIYPSNVTILTKNEKKDYTTNFTNARKSKVLVDFVIAEHSGLSLRTFEALGYDKKLITTNKEIQYYDFYHPNNIFILDNNLDQLTDFLAKPYVQLEPQIKQKYSFTNWINYILNISPHQPILLPKNEP